MNLLLVNRYVFFTAVAYVTAIIIIYTASILYYYNKRDTPSQDMDEYPDVTILIPTHNEKKIIHKRIENIFQMDYPKENISVIFIDDSSDSTPEIIQEYVDNNSNFKLLRFNERMGYSPSIMAGTKEAKTNIIILNEAGSMPSPDSVKKMVRHFQNSRVGSVSGRSSILNVDENVGKIESLYLRILNLLRQGESNMDSTFSIQGEAMAVRRDLVKDIYTAQDTGSVDTSMAFEVRLKGFKSLYDPDVVFHEYAPSDRGGWIKQKTIRAANWMRILLIYKEMLLNPGYGRYGFIILPFYFNVLFLFPFLALLAALNVSLGIIIDPFFQQLGIAIGIILVLLLLLSRNLVILLVQIEISLINAVYQIIKKRSHDKIERVESTRRV